MPLIGGPSWNPGSARTAESQPRGCLRGFGAQYRGLKSSFTGNMDVDIDVDIDIDSYFQVSSGTVYGIEEVMALTLLILK